MKRIIITIASLLLASATMNAQTKAKVKKVKTVAKTAISNAAAISPSMVPPPPPPPPPPPMPGRDMQMPSNPGMPPMPGTPGMPSNTGASIPPAQQVPPAEVYDFTKYAKVDEMEHDFGNVKQLPEGVTTTFTITNISKEPLLIENVQASCGCTIPTWDKSPIAPGKKGSFQAKFNSQGRPGPFTKSLTISTNRGKQAVTIKGNVESTPVVAPTPGMPEVPVPVGH